MPPFHRFHPGHPTIYKGLVTYYGEGGLQNRGGACEVLPLRKGGAEKVLAGYLKVLACLEGGAKSFGPAIFPFCSSPPPPSP